MYRLHVQQQKNCSKPSHMHEFLVNTQTYLLRMADMLQLHFKIRSSRQYSYLLSSYKAIVLTSALIDLWFVLIVLLIKSSLLIVLLFEGLLTVVKSNISISVFFCRTIITMVKTIVSMILLFDYCQGQCVDSPAFLWDY